MAASDPFEQIFWNLFLINLDLSCRDYIYINIYYQKNTIIFLQERLRIWMYISMEGS